MNTLKSFKEKVITYATKKGIQVLETYKNGNFFVGICSDGTRIKETIDPNSDRFLPEFALNVDVKITNHCAAGCKFCHEGSGPEGVHADLNLPIFDTWKAGTETAIGGGNVLDHPDLIPFLKKLKKRRVIRNITINQKAVHEQFDLVEKLLKEELVNGIGVSITNPLHDAQMKAVQTLFNITNNAVAHVIVGLVDESFLPVLENKKVLFLGYKNNVGRGKSFGETYATSIRKHIAWLKEKLPELKYSLKVMSFDNLALAQLDAKNILDISQEEWNLKFQGKDYGDFNGKNAPSTFYLDAVNKTIGRSSTQPYEERIPYTGQSFVKAFKSSLSNYTVNEEEYGEGKF